MQFQSFTLLKTMVIYAVESGAFPKMFKLAIVIPLHKNASTTIFAQSY